MRSICAPIELPLDSVIDHNGNKYQVNSFMLKARSEKFLNMNSNEEFVLNDEFDEISFLEFLNVCLCKPVNMTPELYSSIYLIATFYNCESVCSYLNDITIDNCNLKNVVSKYLLKRRQNQDSQEQLQLILDNFESIISQNLLLCMPFIEICNICEQGKFSNEIILKIVNSIQHKYSIQSLELLGYGEFEGQEEIVQILNKHDTYLGRSIKIVIDAKNTQIGELSNQVALLQNSNTEKMQKLDEIEKKMNELAAENSLLKEQINNEKLKSDNEIKEINDNFNKCMINHKSEILALNQKHDAEVQQFKSEILALNQKHDAEVQQFKNEISNQKIIFTDSVAFLKNDYEFKLNKIKEDCDRSIQELTIKKDSELEDIKSIILGKDTEIQNQIEQIAKLNSELENLQSKIVILEKSINEFETKNSFLQNELEISKQSLEKVSEKALLLSAGSEFPHGFDPSRKFTIKIGGKFLSFSNDELILSENSDIFSARNADEGTELKHEKTGKILEVSHNKLCLSTLTGRRNQRFCAVGGKLGTCVGGFVSELGVTTSLINASVISIDYITE